jgi:hypothetical protein
MFQFWKAVEKKILRLGIGLLLITDELSQGILSLVKHLRVMASTMGPSIAP